MGSGDRGFECDQACRVHGRGRRRTPATDMAATTKAHDELELSYRLESETGTVLMEGKSRQKAKSDGDDLLTPLVEHAAEEIAAVVTR